ncbi:hypothetical protein MY04_5279 [Flammeovirga sp. MY04]|uniref:carbohydrate binding domain-containing protein n=1 Tax=Flammeovirga sp. MY04 TaxID=1191459 RepID=UPI0008271FF9|nr:carbohydrate binding domain-containing protein [Flammeovirga sp. MY04]ANQ52611.2 hypothetical protein MY04_5279 [Flammeovirga sp. MY04]
MKAIYKILILISVLLLGGFSCYGQHTLSVELEVGTSAPFYPNEKCTLILRLTNHSSLVGTPSNLGMYHTLYDKDGNILSSSKLIANDNDPNNYGNWLFPLTDTERANGIVGKLEYTFLPSDIGYVEFTPFGYIVNDADGYFNTKIEDVSPLKVRVNCSEDNLSMLLFNYPGFGQGDYKDFITLDLLCQLDLSNQFSKVSEGPTYNDHFEILDEQKNSINDQTVVDFTNDLEKFIIYQPGVYYLKHTFNYSCYGGEGTSTREIKYTINSLDATTLVDETFLENFSAASLQIYCDPLDLGGNYNYIKHKDVNNEYFTLYRENESSEYVELTSKSNYAEYDITDLSDFIIHKPGKYKLKHAYSFCSDKRIEVVKFYDFDVTQLLNPYESSVCKACESNSNLCESLEESFSNSNYGNFKSISLVYRNDCESENKQFPSELTNGIKFLNVYYGNTIYLDFISSDCLQNKKFKFTNIADPTDYKWFYDNEITFTGDLFKNGGVFLLEAKTDIDACNVFSSSHSRTLKVYVCVTTILEPKYKNGNLTLCQEDPLDLGYKFEHEEIHYPVEYYEWAFDPTKVFKINDEYFTLLQLLEEGSGFEYLSNENKISDNNIDDANSHLGEKWIEIRSIYTKDGKTVKSSQFTDGAIKKVNVSLSRPAPFDPNRPEYKAQNIIEVNANEELNISDFIHDKFTNSKGQKISYSGVLSYIDITNSKDYKNKKARRIGNNNDTFILTEEVTKKEFLVYREANYPHYYYDEKNKEIVYEYKLLQSDPTRLVFVGKPTIKESVICPYKFKFVNQFNASISGVKIDYIWETFDSNNKKPEGGESNYNTFIFDYALNAEGKPNENYEVHLKVNYTLLDDFNFGFSNEGCNNDQEFPLEIKIEGKPTKIAPLSVPALFDFGITTYHTPDSRIYENGLSISAISYDDKWFIDGVSNFERIKLNNLSPWIGGYSGTWRPHKTFTYLVNRQNTFTLHNSYVKVKEEGVMPIESFKWKGNATMIFPEEQEKWINTTTSSKYGKRGQGIESKDALGNFGAALYIHNGEYVKAVVSNARQNEMFFTSFEEDNNDAFFSNTFTYRIPVIAGKGMLAVVGDYQEKLDEIFTYDQSVVFVKGVEYQKEIPSTFIYKALVSCKFDYLLDETNLDHDTIFPEMDEEGGNEKRYTLMGLDGFGMQELDDWKGEIIAHKIDENLKIIFQENDLSHLISTTEAHTGNNSLRIVGTENIKLKHLDLEKNKKYTISLWVKGDDANQTIQSFEDQFAINIEGITFTPRGLIIEGWQRLEGTFTYNQEKFEGLTLAFSTTDNEEVYVDDLRIYPANAKLQTYYYHPSNYRLMSISDENNFATFYSYDEEGNLQLTRKETVNGILTLQEVQSNIVN